MPHSTHFRALLLAVAVASLSAGAPEIGAQQVTEQLFAGDSVRVDGVLIGRVLNIEGRNATVLSREKPKCRAGEGHGDAPICDPAPLIRREIDLTVSTVERRVQKGNLNTRTFVGGLLGTAAFGAAGYFIGPLVGFGKVDGCLEASTSTGCTPAEVVPADVLEERQRSRDQKIGAMFFGVIGGTAAAIFTRKLSSGWVRFEPTLPMGSEDAWGVEVVVPGVR